MPLVAAFTATQDAGLPSSITFQDTSSGSDGAVNSRAIFLTKADGTRLVETGVATDYTPWPLADTSITLDLLPKDLALVVTVLWLDTDGDTLYTATTLYGFTLYNEAADYSLTQELSGNPILINDNNFWPNKSKFRCLIDSGNQAISLASDIYGAQVCYDLATAIRLNSQYLFNTNS